jgi:hypothetical protein
MTILFQSKRILSQRPLYLFGGAVSNSYSLTHSLTHTRAHARTHARTTHTHTHTHARPETTGRRAPRSEKKKPYSSCVIERVTTHVSLNYLNWTKKGSFCKKTEMKTNSEKSIRVFYHKYVPGRFTLPLNTNTRNVPKAVWFRLQLQTLIQKLNKLKPKIELLFGESSHLNSKPDCFRHVSVFVFIYNGESPSIRQWSFTY